MLLAGVDEADDEGDVSVVELDESEPVRTGCCGEGWGKGCNTQETYRYLCYSFKSSIEWQNQRIF